MKRILPALILCVLAAAPSLARADKESHRKAAEKVLDAMNLQKTLDASIDQMLELQVKQNPQLGQFKDVMRKFFAKHMSYESLKEDLIKMYTEELSEEDLLKTAEFFQSPAGKRYAEKLPVMSAKGAQLGAAKVQANLGELQKMIMEEAKKKMP